MKNKNKKVKGKCACCEFNMASVDINTWWIDSRSTNHIANSL